MLYNLPSHFLQAYAYCTAAAFIKCLQHVHFTARTHGFRILIVCLLVDLVWRSVHWMLQNFAQWTDNCIVLILLDAPFQTKPYGTQKTVYKKQCIPLYRKGKKGFWLYIPEKHTLCVWYALTAYCDRSWRSYGYYLHIFGHFLRGFRRFIVLTCDGKSWLVSRLSDAFLYDFPIVGFDWRLPSFFGDALLQILQTVRWILSNFHRFSNKSNSTLYVG